jgi:hypothetical protein
MYLIQTVKKIGMKLNFLTNQIRSVSKIKPFSSILKYKIFTLMIYLYSFNDISLVLKEMKDLIQMALMLKHQ